MTPPQGATCSPARRRAGDRSRDMGNEYDKAVRQIQQERHAICEINAIFAMLGITSWLGPSYLALAALSLILVVNATFPFRHRRRVQNARTSAFGLEPAGRSIPYERYMICVVNAVFAILGIVSWWGLSWLALVALVVLLALNLTFPLQHRRRLLEAKQRQVDYRMKSLCS